MSVFFFLYLILRFIISAPKSITNSSGQYFVSPSTIYEKYDEIVCTHSEFCYIRCDSSNTTNCSNLKITAHSSSNVFIHCTQCNYLQIFCNANNFTMIYNSSNYGQFHLENASNIDINYMKVGYSIIYAQYANNFNILFSKYWNYRNIFYLDYVSNEINFEYSSNVSSSRDTTISASNANYFNLSIPHNLEFLTFTGIIYCPYHDVNVCNFHISSIEQIDDIEIFVSEMKSADTCPLYVYLDTNSSFSLYDTFTINCNENIMDGIYESSTDIYYSQITNRFECKNITSECCYLLDHRKDIFCPHDDICNVDCNIIDCVNHNIYPSNLTVSLNVTCGYKNCYNTIINCPTKRNSSCYVSCDKDWYSCYYTVIKYNTNNKDIDNLNCIGPGSCDYLQVFIDKIENESNFMNNVNISCWHCDDSSFIINTELRQLNIMCEGCSDLEINARFTQNININCSASSYGSCRSLTIYPQTDSVDALSINCGNQNSCKQINIMSPLQYRLDYVSITGDAESCLSKIDYFSSIATCDHSGDTSHFVNKTSSTNICQCDSNIFCCPFSNSFDIIKYCDDGENCQINLDHNNEATIIYANNANSLSISCRNCSFVNIFAMNASIVSIKCMNECQYIHLNGFYVNTFNLECSLDNNSSSFLGFFGCNKLIIDISNAENVDIMADNISNTEIYASNASVFSLLCVECKSLDLAIPSTTSIKCMAQCNYFSFYTNYRWNYTQFATVCDLTAPLLGPTNWTFYCPSPINKYAYYDYKQKSRLKKTFIPCKDINYKKYISIQITHDPFSSTCRGHIDDSISSLKMVQRVFEMTIFIVSLVIITCWLIIFGKRMFLKYINYMKYDYVMNIEPPSTKILCSIYFNDLFIWISQIYIIVICWIFYGTICDDMNSNGQYGDDDIVCLMRHSCSWDGYECTVTTAVYIFVMTMTISLSLSMVCVLLSTWCLCDDIFDEKQFNIFSHFICITCCCCYNNNKWNTMINDYYLKRNLFIFKHGMIRLLFIGITRYLLVFLPVLILFFVFSVDGFSVNWYCIFPILLVICLNEIIKKQYKMCQPYDKFKHIQYILQQIYGDHLGSIIWVFMGDDNDINEEEMVLFKQNYKMTDKENGEDIENLTLL